MDRPFDRALGQLADLSLVERVSGGAAIRVHPLVRDFVTRRPDPEALSALQAEAAARLASALDDTGRLEREFSARGVGGLLGDLDLAVAWSTAPSPARGSADELRRVLERERLHFPPGPGSADGLPPDFLQQMHYRSHLMGLGHLSDRLCRTAMERIGLFLVGVGVSGTDDMALVRSMKLERREETSQSERGVRIISPCPGGRHVLTAGWQTLVLWDVATGQIVRTFHGHSSYIMDVRVSPDARTAVSAERDNVFIRWRLDTTNPVRVIPPNMQAVDQLVPQCQLHAVSLGADGNVAFCSYDNRDAVRHRKEEGRSVLALWNLETGEPLAVNPGRSPCCNAVHLDADRQVSLTGDALDGRIMLWDLSTGQVVRDMTADTNSEYKVNSISAVLLSADGRHILSSANQVVVWQDLGEGRPVHVLRGHSQTVTDIALAADSCSAVSGSFDKTLIIWDLETGRSTRVLRGHGEGFDAIALGASAGTLLSGSHDGTLACWDLRSATQSPPPLVSPAAIEALALSKDGRRAMTIQAGKATLWDAPSGVPLRVLEYGTAATRWALMDSKGRLDEKGSSVISGGVASVDLDETGRRALLGSWNGKLVDLDLDSGRCKQVIPCHSPVTTLSLSGDGSRAQVGFYDGTLQLLDMSDEPTCRTLPLESGRPSALAWAADEGLVLTGSESGRFVLWELKTASTIATVEHGVDQLKRWAFADINRSGGAVTALDAAADGKRWIAVFTDDEPVCLDRTGRECYRMRGHSHVVTVARVSPSGRVVVTGSRDESLITWDGDTGQPLRKLVVGARPVDLAVADGAVVFTDSIGRAHFLRIEGRRN